ncbi:MAG: hypothetical protein ACP5NX_02195 [Candidatus Bilamarchaeaceae archaeon]
MLKVKEQRWFWVRKAILLVLALALVFGCIDAPAQGQKSSEQADNTAVSIYEEQAVTLAYFDSEISGTTYKLGIAFSDADGTYSAVAGRAAVSIMDSGGNLLYSKEFNVEKEDYVETFDAASGKNMLETMLSFPTTDVQKSWYTKGSIELRFVSDSGKTYTRVLKDVDVPVLNQAEKTQAFKDSSVTVNAENREKFIMLRVHNIGPYIENGKKRTDLVMVTGSIVNVGPKKQYFNFKNAVLYTLEKTDKTRVHNTQTYRPELSSILSTVQLERNEAMEFYFVFPGTVTDLYQFELLIDGSYGFVPDDVGKPMAIQLPLYFKVGKTDQGLGY